jgi:hypothetical protein
MGVTIQAESHRNELAGVYEKEHDPATPDEDASARLREQERRVGWGNARLASGEVLEREPQLCEVRDPRV